MGTIEQPHHEQRQDSAGRGPGRRAVIGAVVWSVPVITVVTAAPALAASGTYVLSRTMPVAPEVTTDTTPSPATTVNLEVLLTQAGSKVEGATIVWSFSGAAGVSLGRSVSSTAPDGLSQSSLMFPSSQPTSDGSLGTVTATAAAQGVSVVWDVTYRPLTVAEAVVVYKTTGGNHRVGGFVIGDVRRDGTVQTTRDTPGSGGPMFDNDATLALAGTRDETDPANMIFVVIQNNALSDTWGLRSNPSLQGQQIVVTGTVRDFPGYSHAAIDATAIKKAGEPN